MSKFVYPELIFFIDNFTKLLSQFKEESQKKIVLTEQPYFLASPLYESNIESSGLVVFLLKIQIATLLYCFETK